MLGIFEAFSLKTSLVTTQAFSKTDALAITKGSATGLPNSCSYLRILAWKWEILKIVVTKFNSVFEALQICAYYLLPIP